MHAESIPDSPADPDLAGITVEVKRLQLLALRAYQPIALTHGGCHPRAIREYRAIQCRLARYTALLNAALRVAGE